MPNKDDERLYGNLKQPIESMGNHQRPKTDAGWLLMIQEAAKDTCQVGYTVHARERMRQRNITSREVLNTLRRGHFIEPPHDDNRADGHWKARLKHTGLTVVIGFDPDNHPLVLDVVTTFWNTQ